MKNLLTDKTLKAFEEWMRPNPLEHGRFGQLVTNTFENLPDSMQYGVIVDFFDSVGILLWIEYYPPRGNWHVIICEPNKTGTHKGYNILANSICDGIPVHNTRPEARKAAVEKANELYNQK